MACQPTEEQLENGSVQTEEYKEENNLTDVQEKQDKEVEIIEDNLGKDKEPANDQIDEIGQDGESSDDKNENEIVLEKQYEIVIENSNGINLILNPENILTLVNKEYSLAASYTPDNLVIPNVHFPFGNKDIPKMYVRDVVANALEQMFNEAKKDDIILYAVSGYRSYDTQKAIYEAEVAEVGQELASKAVAFPGQSEHQTGLAMDVTSQSVDFLLTTSLAETKEGIWLKENAHKFGFIIRYPQEKENITGYQYEPWHLRYVGKEFAMIIKENELTLEEFFGLVKNEKED